MTQEEKDYLRRFGIVEVFSSKQAEIEYDKLVYYLGREEARQELWNSIIKGRNNPNE